MRPVLFVDFDGTICFDRFWRGLPPEEQAVMGGAVFGGERVNAWMRGRHTAEEMNRLVAAAVGRDERVLWEAFVEECRTMSIAPSTLDLLAALREKHFLVLITDNMDCFDRFTVPALGLEEHFDAILNSFTEGTLKSDDGGRIFLVAAERYGADIRECMLLDNSRRVCELFRALGGRALLVTPEEPVDHWLRELAAEPGV